MTTIPTGIQNNKHQKNIESKIRCLMPDFTKREIVDKKRQPTHLQRNKKYASDKKERINDLCFLIRNKFILWRHPLLSGSMFGAFERIRIFLSQLKTLYHETQDDVPGSSSTGVAILRQYENHHVNLH